MFLYNHFLLLKYLGEVGKKRENRTRSFTHYADSSGFLIQPKKRSIKTLENILHRRLDGVTANDDEWHHICTTWENGEGSWHFYIDAELKGSGRDFQTGHVISSGGIVILGQDQDEYGGGFESDQSFNGKMFGVNMWDYEMSEDEIVQLFSRCFGPEGNYLKWGDFKGGEEGDVEIEAPTTCLPLQ